MSDISDTVFYTLNDRMLKVSSQRACDNSCECVFRLDSNRVGSCFNLERNGKEKRIMKNLEKSFQTLISMGSINHESAYRTIAALIIEALECGVHKGMDEEEIVKLLKNPYIEQDRPLD